MPHAPALQIRRPHSNRPFKGRLTLCVSVYALSELGSPSVQGGRPCTSRVHGVYTVRGVWQSSPYYSSPFNRARHRVRRSGTRARYPESSPACTVYSSFIKLYTCTRWGLGRSGLGVQPPISQPCSDPGYHPHLGECHRRTAKARADASHHVCTRQPAAIAPSSSQRPPADTSSGGSRLGSRGPWRSPERCGSAGARDSSRPQEPLGAND